MKHGLVPIKSQLREIFSYSWLQWDVHGRGFAVCKHRANVIVRPLPNDLTFTCKEPLSRLKCIFLWEIGARIQRPSAVVDTSMVIIHPAIAAGRDFNFPPTKVG